MERLSNLPTNPNELQPAGFIERMGVAALTTPLYYRDRFIGWKRSPHFAWKGVLLGLGIVAAATAINTKPWEGFQSIPLEQRASVPDSLPYAGFITAEGGQMNLGNLTTGLDLEVDQAMLVKLSRLRAADINARSDQVYTLSFYASKYNGNDRDRESNWINSISSRLPRGVQQVIGHMEVEVILNKEILKGRSKDFLTQQELDLLGSEISVKWAEFVRNGASRVYTPIHSQAQKLIADARPITVRGVSKELLERSVNFSY